LIDDAQDGDGEFYTRPGYGTAKVDGNTSRGGKMAERVTIGMTGCGGMMGAHERGFRELWDKGIRNFEIVATCDLVKSLAEKMADQVGGWQGKRPRVYSDVETMLKSEPDMMGWTLLRSTVRIIRWLCRALKPENTLQWRSRSRLHSELAS